jgi:hypothetical protein
MILNEQNNDFNSKVSSTQLELIAKFTKKLTDNVIGIQSWNYQHDTLEVVILTSNETSIDIATLVSNFEQLDYIESVSLQRVGSTGNRWEVSAKVTL